QREASSQSDQFPCPPVPRAGTMCKKMYRPRVNRLTERCRALRYAATTLSRRTVSGGGIMTDVLAQVIERASIDPTFRAQLQSDPEAALVGYALTVEEKAQLRLGEPAHAEPLGLDV